MAFESQSEVFRDMFSLSTESPNEEGICDERPIKLHQGTSLAFRDLLQILYSGFVEHPKEYSRLIALIGYQMKT